MGRMADHMFKRHVPVEEALAQLGLGDESSRHKRDTPYSNDSLPEYYTHEFDTHNFALPVYTGIEKNEVRVRARVQYLSIYLSLFL